MTLEFDDLRSRRKPREKTVAVPLDEEVLSEIEALEHALKLARHLDETENRPAQAPRIERELEQARESAVDAAEQFTFRELPRPDYRRLMAQHPDPQGKLRWNEDTFAPALIAACCV
ncbi:MAG: hypothetical protein WD313_02485, partial [Acidimicrobiia bacterium]